MLHWLDYCSLNGVTSRELFLIVQFFTPLRDALNDVFYPIVLGGSVSEHEVRLFF